MPSFEKTSAMLLIERHYEVTGLSDGWKWPAVQSLAERMELQPQEILCLVGVSPREAFKMMRANKVPLTVSLHLESVDRFWRHRKLGRPLDSPMPVDLLPL